VVVQGPGPRVGGLDVEDGVAQAPAGEVVEAGEDGAVVALDGGALAISRMRLESGEKVGPGEVPGLAAGLRLGAGG
jgi:methionyl-tRNA formyltransferase